MYDRDYYRGFDYTPYNTIMISCNFCIFSLYFDDYSTIKILFKDKQK